MTIQDLQDRLRASMLSDADKLTAAALVADLADLTARQLTGEDISGELVHVRAQAANLAAGAASQVAAEFRLWATQVVAGVLTGAL